MVDLSKTIIAKSDQLNSDDLMGGAITVKIRDVTQSGAKEQPICIYYEGDDNKPYKPCKSMLRVLVAAWGVNGKLYNGRMLRLYRDEKVKWAGQEVGGIRISHMSDIDKPLKLALTAAKGSKKLYTVEPLNADSKPTKKEITLEQAEELITNAANEGLKSLTEAWKKLSADQQKQLANKKDELKVIASAVDDIEKVEITTNGEANA